MSRKKLLSRQRGSQKKSCINKKKKKRKEEGEFLGRCNTKRRCAALSPAAVAHALREPAGAIVLAAPILSVAGNGLCSGKEGTRTYIMLFPPPHSVPGRM